jgi:hypothetical protein
MELALSSLFLRQSIDKLRLRNLCVRGVFTAMAGNEPRTDAKSSPVWPPCHLTSRPRTDAKCRKKNQLYGLRLGELGFLIELEQIKIV